MRQFWDQVTSGGLSLLLSFSLPLSLSVTALEKRQSIKLSNLGLVVGEGSRPLAEWDSSLHIHNVCDFLVLIVVRRMY